MTVTVTVVAVTARVKNENETSVGLHVISRLQDEIDKTTTCDQ